MQFLLGVWNDSFTNLRRDLFVHMFFRMMDKLVHHTSKEQLKLEKSITNTYIRLSIWLENMVIICLWNVEGKTVISHDKIQLPIINTVPLSRGRLSRNWVTIIIFCPNYATFDMHHLGMIDPLTIRNWVDNAYI